VDRHNAIRVEAVVVEDRAEAEEDGQVGAPEAGSPPGAACAPSV